MPDSERTASFDPDGQLQRVAEFTVEALAHGRFRVGTAEGGSVHVADALRVLDAFAQPRTARAFAAAAAERAPSATAWIEAMETVRLLVEVGVLRLSGTPAPRVAEHGFASETQHVLMLNDTSRTGALIDAIRAQVKPDDVVLDVGTGTGVLAVAAAQAGARRVYALERSAMTIVAQSLAERNGVADRITVIRDASTNVTLSERADVVVSEILGDDLFAEDLLPTMADAASRLAKPDARFIPRSVFPVLQALQLSDDELNRRRYSSDATQRWHTRFGMDFTPLLDPALRPSLSRWIAQPRNLKAHLVGDPLELAPVQAPWPRTYSELVHWPGEPGANALTMGFRADLGSGFVLTTAVHDAAKDCHWSVPVWAPVPGHDIGFDTPSHFRVCWDGGQTRLRLVNE